jgi:hypothetical protein
LNNDEVWADGLLVFYEIFKYLEENVSSTVLPVEYNRTHMGKSKHWFFKKKGSFGLFNSHPCDENTGRPSHDLMGKCSLQIVGKINHLATLLQISVEGSGGFDQFQEYEISSIDITQVNQEAKKAKTELFDLIGCLWFSLFDHQFLNFLRDPWIFTTKIAKRSLDFLN